MSLTVPLFPLNTVLFPGGVLPLRIFEPRYLDMVSDCLRHNTEIGVIQIQEGSEVGKAAHTYQVGTLSTISYWNRRADGLLGITLRGVRRFRLLDAEVKANQLIMAKVEPLPDCPPLAIQQKYQGMATLLRKIISQLEPPYTTMPAHYDDLEWISARLVELLPMSLDFKQQLLEHDDIFLRIERLVALIQQPEVG
ncbi:MAG: LON peptidase substrate-binding domain-containing protein [Thioalkalispiraceae bacterium]